MLAEEYGSLYELNQLFQENKVPFKTLMTALDPVDSTSLVALTLSSSLELSANAILPNCRPLAPILDRLNVEIFPISSPLLLLLQYSLLNSAIFPVSIL